VDYLENEGFSVKCVTTLADVAYNKGPGSVYQDYYLPAHRVCETNPKHYKGTQEQRDTVKVYCEQTDTFCKGDAYQKKLAQLKIQITGSDPKLVCQKHFMFRYLQDKFPKLRDKQLEYYDDDANCLREIENIDEKIMIHPVINQDSLTLVIPNWDMYQKVVTDELSKLPKDHSCRLLPGKLSQETMRNIATREFEELTILYEYSPTFRSKLDAQLSTQNADFSKFSSDIRSLLNSDPASARRNIITIISVMIQPSDLYRLMTQIQKENEIIFNAESVNISIFDFFPDLSRKLISKNGEEYNKGLSQLIGAMCIELKSRSHMHEAKIAEIIKNVAPTLKLEEIPAVLTQSSFLFWNNANEGERIKQLKEIYSQLRMVIRESDKLCLESSAGNKH
jgi:hypothetical protein